MIKMNDELLTKEAKAELENLSQNLNTDEPPELEDIEELKDRIEELESDLEDAKEDVESERQRADENFDKYDTELKYAETLEERRSIMYRKIEAEIDSIDDLFGCVLKDTIRNYISVLENIESFDKLDDEQ